MTQRKLWVADEAVADYVRERLAFPGVRQVAQLHKYTFHPDGRETVERWYLITSLSAAQASPHRLMKLVRQHWDIENGVHHVKDRTLREDAHRVRQRNLGAVLTLLRTVALNALRLAPGFRKGASIAQRSRHFALHPMKAMRLAGLG